MTYYISPEGKAATAYVCKSLRAFAERKGTPENEGTRWTVRTRSRIKGFEILPTYEMRNGKLKKIDTFHCFFSI